MFLLEDKIQSYIDKLDINIDTPFGGYPWQDDYDDPIGRAEMPIHADYIKYKIYHGASKVVVDLNTSLVIKIPLNGGWYVEEKEDENGNWIEDPSTEHFEYFSGTSSSESDWNYCENEVRLYEEVKEEGFEKFYLETKFYGYTKGGYPIYIQEKVTCKHAPEKPSKKSLKIAEANCPVDLDGCEEWLAALYDYYGEEEVNDFLDFINNYDDYAQDIHPANIGYTADGRPVIVDYAGFLECI